MAAVTTLLQTMLLIASSNDNRIYWWYSFTFFAKHYTLLSICGDGGGSVFVSFATSPTLHVVVDVVLMMVELHSTSSLDHIQVAAAAAHTYILFFFLLSAYYFFLSCCWCCWYYYTTCVQLMLRFNLAMTTHWSPCVLLADWVTGNSSSSRQTVSLYIVII